MGTPRTGRVVCAATTPARCAAPPAAQIRTSSPRASACEAYSATARGERCADMTRMAAGTPKSRSVSRQGCIVGRSLSEPIRMATFVPGGTTGAW